MITPKQKIIIQTNKESVDLLRKALTRLKQEENAKEFLSDIFSSAEILDVARRLMAAKLLYEEKTYQEITDLMGMGPLTIAKIHTKTRGSQVLPEILKDL